MMFCALAMAAALISGVDQSTGAVELRNVQACYGRYGPTRTKLEVAPNEELMFRFVIAGLKTTTEGTTDALLNVTLADASGREVINQTQPIRTPTPFGADFVPGTTNLVIGPTASPGEYQLRVTIEDKLATSSARFVRKVTIRPAGFSIINPRFFVDPARSLDGPCGGLIGQTMYFRAQIAEPSRKDGRTAVTMKLRLTDLEGHDVMRAPVIVHREMTSDFDYHALAVEAEMPLGRSGEFLLWVTAIDENTKQEVTQQLPMTIAMP
jgi:hypothetical protein